MEQSTTFEAAQLSVVSALNEQTLAKTVQEDGHNDESKKATLNLNSSEIDFQQEEPATTRHCNMDPTPDYVLHLVDGSQITAGEMLASPDKYNGTKFIDPFEPVTENQFGTFYANADLGTPVFQKELVNTKPIVNPAKEPWPFITAGALSLEPRKEIIKGILPANALAALNGEPGRGKTFLAIDLLASVAIGIDWHGHLVKTQGPVVYVPGEGLDDIKYRLEAWCQQHNINRKDLPFFISEKVATLSDEDEVKKLMKGIQSLTNLYGAPVIIAFDTLSRNIGSADENSSKDMAGIIRAADRVRKVADSTILFIHHTGLSNKDRPRGSSVLPGALDANYILKPKDSILELSGLKNKTSPSASNLFFRLTQVGIGIYDEDGDEVTTCIIEPEVASTSPKSTKLSGQNKIAMDALEDLQKNGQTPCPSDTWRDHAIKMNISSSTDKDSLRKIYNRAKKYLFKCGLVIEDQNGMFEPK